MPTLNLDKSPRWYFGAGSGSESSSSSSSSSAVGHVALSVHHASHSQHRRPDKGEEVHRRLWDGGLRDADPGGSDLLPVTPLLFVLLLLTASISQTGWHPPGLTSDKAGHDSKTSEGRFPNATLDKSVWFFWRFFYLFFGSWTVGLMSLALISDDVTLQNPHYMNSAAFYAGKRSKSGPPTRSTTEGLYVLSPSCTLLWIHMKDPDDWRWSRSLSFPPGMQACECISVFLLLNVRVLMFLFKCQEPVVGLFNVERRVWLRL